MTKEQQDYEHERQRENMKMDFATCIDILRDNVRKISEAIIEVSLTIDKLYAMKKEIEKL